MEIKKRKINPSQWSAYLTLTKYIFLAFLRSRAALIFGFLFPLVFIAVFGFIGNQTTQLKIGITDSSTKDNPVYQALEKVEIVKLQTDSKDNLNNLLLKGKIDGYVEILNQDRGVNINAYTNSAYPQTKAQFLTILGSISDKLNLVLSGVNNPPVKVKETEISGRKYTYIDFALPGQLGFSLLSTAIFGTAFGLVFLKKTLVLKRIFASPTKPVTIILAQGTARLIMAFLQTSLILLVGVFVFNFYLAKGAETILIMALLVVLGLVVFLGFGLFLAGIAKDENSIGPVINLVTLPQFLLSGSFFPIDAFPEWLQTIARFLPLTFLNDAMRMVANDGASIQDILQKIAGLIAWGLIMYIIAALTFKWE